ncbi:MAG: ABC transporter substrate-binding protein [Janthinobacterium lividum]
MRKNSFGYPAKRSTNAPATFTAAALGAALLCLSSGAAFGQSLRVGMLEDVDSLDPHRANTYVSRLVFASLCDSLVDISADLKIAPKLALSWTTSADGRTLTFKLRPGVKFQDGEPFDAAAVKTNIERAMTLPESSRKSELASVQRVDVVDPLTVAFILKTPDAALLATLTDRAGMMLAPKTLADTGGVARHPVCAGPYQFVERVQNDRIVLSKFAGYWDGAHYPLQKLVFTPIPDSTVRLANLRSNNLDMIERLSPNDVASVRKDPALQLMVASGLGYRGLTLNVGNGARANGPLKDLRVRQALALSIDRDALNQVAGGGTYPPANQGVPTSSPYHDKAITTPKRDPEKAKALLKAAGHERVGLDMLIGNDTSSSQIGEMIQAMAAEANIDIKLRPVDNPTLLSEGKAGRFDIMLLAWSGRSDPDGNLLNMAGCGGPLNYGQYCDKEVDAMLRDARQKSDPAARKALYDKAQETMAKNVEPVIYLFYQQFPFVLSRKIHGFAPFPDGLIRLRDVSLN